MGTDVNSDVNRYVCTMHHFRYFLDVNVKYEAELYNIFHDLMMIAISFNEVAIFSVNGVRYRLLAFWYK